jgi:oxygen-dependent protoporphyrinogen oxidase
VSHPDAGASAALPHVAIIGGGISGVAAAFFLRDTPVRVTVFEGSPRLGGKLAISEVAGIAVDEGAEALLARRPEGTGLIRDIGLGDELVEPGTTSSAIWTRGELRPLPRRQFMGVPADLAELARSGIVSDEGARRAGLDLELPPTDRAGDVPVGQFVAARLGQEVVDRLVDPLLGGVYAGLSAQLSFEATLPALAAASLRHRSLAEAAGSLLPAPPPGADGGAARKAAGVFTTLAAGLGTLPAAVADASGAVVRTGSAVRELARTTTGWRLTVGSAAAPESVAADAVILALPARPAGRLLAGVHGAGAAAAALDEIPYASMAIVTLAYPRLAFPEPPARGGSGYLVPAVDGHAVKAVTFSTRKWPHLAGGMVGAEPDDAGLAKAGSASARQLDIVRCSVGRLGEEELLQREDAELAKLAAAELTEATGVRGDPVDWRVTRWGGALPQYMVGHLDRVASIRAAVAAQPGLAICGAAFDGVGIPACVATARMAADHVLGHVKHRND